MDPFSYLVVLTSIVLGFGVTRVVGGLGQLLQTRKRREPYWVHTLWSLNLLLVMTIIWWVAYRWHLYARWTFFLFLWLLLSPIVLYLIASLLFPNTDEDEPVIDWQTYLYATHRDIFLLLALIFPIDVIDTLFKGMAHFREQGPVYFSTMGLWFTPAWWPLSPKAPDIRLSSRFSFCFTTSGCSALRSSPKRAFLCRP